MNEIEEFKRVWSEYGIPNVKDYQEKAFHLSKDEEFVSKFQKINYKNFWLAAHEFFGTDPIANNSRTLAIEKDIEKIEGANRNNWSIANYMGIAGSFDLFFDNCKVRNIRPHIAEIGSGYGSIFEYLKTRDNYDYTGFDLISRFDDVVEVEGEDGCLSDGQLHTFASKFTLIYSFNVFQHLEKFQIEKYINQAYTMLDKTKLSCFILGICLDTETFHYGQKIILPTSEEFHSMIDGKFKICSCNKSYVKNHHNLHVFYLDTIK